MGEEFAGQWAILPAMVRYDRSLPANAKLVYAEIAAKANTKGYCYAHNRYFAELFQLKEDTISSLINKLARAGYIFIDLDAGRGNNDKRRIYLTGKPYDFTGKMSDKGIGFKTDTGKMSGAVSDLKPGPLENNNLKLNTPYIPPEGGAPPPPKPKKPRKAPADWEPEIFERFWKAYPRGEGKQAAKRAWNKLKPDADLRRRMAKALQLQLDTPDWNGGIFPHASTWLNGRRWEDEVREAARVSAAERQNGVYERWS